jgi:acyl-CoA synthetase (AMP-forming)/AMP-acid ligase II
VSDPLVDGWFPTGDVSTIDADGYMQITDRSKDVIKSGGEWIGSIDLENIAMAHPAVAMAGCIGVKHPRWDERPLLVVVKKPMQRRRGRRCSRSTKADRQVVDARRRGLRRLHSAGRDGQDAEAQAARAARGVHAADGLMAATKTRTAHCVTAGHYSFDPAEQVPLTA